jgi:hypothetical protein
MVLMQKEGINTKKERQKKTLTTMIVRVFCVSFVPKIEQLIRKN